MSTSKLSNMLIGAMIFSLLTVMTACASNERGGGQRGDQHGPPPEAIEACQGKSEGDSVSFSGRGGDSVTATCQMVQDQLVAVPEGHKIPQQ